MVMCLRLKFIRRQPRFQMGPQKRHAIPLIRITPQTQPQQMNVIGHQTVRRTKQSFPRGNMQQ
jgi:hypothetical protein